MDLNKKEIIYQLAKGVFNHYGSKAKYGNLRKKLKKQGFSEIALFSFVAMHLEENNISPDNYNKEMVNLLEGCTKNAFFPRTDSGFHYLHGDYYHLRHGDTDRGEPKSPEQRGQFLCNHCALIKPDSERSNRKNYGHSCEDCAQELMRDQGRQSYERKKQRDQEKARLRKLEQEQQVASAEVGEAIEAESEASLSVSPVMPSAVVEEVGEVEETAVSSAPRTVRVVKPAPKQVNGQLMNDGDARLAEVVLGNKIAAIEDITGDADSTIIQVSCATTDLHKILHALSPVLGR